MCTVFSCAAKKRVCAATPPSLQNGSHKVEKASVESNLSLMMRRATEDIAYLEF